MLFQSKGKGERGKSWPLDTNHSERPSERTNRDVDQHVPLSILWSHLPPDKGSGKDRQNGVGQESGLDHHLNDFIHRLNRPLFWRMQHDNGGANQTQCAPNFPIPVKLFFQKDPCQHRAWETRRKKKQIVSVVCWFWIKQIPNYLITTLRPPMGVTRIAGANE